MEYRINRFSYKKEAFQNPYTGFLSFQHFGNDVLYSDCIVRPENNMTETEHYECYPIPEYVEQNGWDEGFYPETSIAYIRILWKEFEREQGVYDYAFIEDILKKAKEKHHSLVFRLMPHSTRAQDDVPDWLKKIIPCPERPDGKRVKDSPTDPMFLKLFSKAVRKLGERFDSDETLESVDVCLPGSWGEGHNLHLYPDEDIQNLYDAFIEAFPTTRLICQIARPELIQYVSEKSEFGWRGDGLGEPNHLRNLYPPRVEKVKDAWKIAPVSFETYWWMGEWQRKGWDLDEIIRQTLEWHVSSLNAKSLPIPLEWKEKTDEWISKMGYHFHIECAEYKETAASGEETELRLTIENTGVAPIYKKHPLLLRLKGETEEYIFETNADITKWMPGKTTLTLPVTLPAHASNKTYNLQLKIPNPITESIAFATDLKTENGWHEIGEIKIH